MRNLKAGLLYFALVFAAGFALGSIRTVWVVPRFGARTAELTETPIMLLVTVLSARWVVRRLEVPSRFLSRFAMGSFALILMLAAEFGFVLWLRGLSLNEYFATRDPISGAVYYLALLVFALMPVFVYSSESSPLFVQGEQKCLSD